MGITIKVRSLNSLLRTSWSYVGPTARSMNLLGLHKETPAQFQNNCSCLRFCSAAVHEDCYCNCVSSSSSFGFYCHHGHGHGYRDGHCSTVSTNNTTIEFIGRSATMRV